MLVQFQQNNIPSITIEGNVDHLWLKISHDGKNTELQKEDKRDQS